jgi:hypothetical protein
LYFGLFSVIVSFSIFGLVFVYYSLKMKLLDTEFEYTGHTLRQIWREHDVAVFERSRSPKHEPHELELVIIKIEPEGKTPTGSIVPEREAYPSASRWGTLGWSFPVRYKEWVLGLGQKLVGISEARPSFVRQATTAFKHSL